MLQQKKWKSNAEWPQLPTARYGVIMRYTEDTHYTKEEAEAVCHRLREQGFGGDRAVFPLRAWVTELPCAHLNVSGGADVDSVCQDCGKVLAHAKPAVSVSACQQVIPDRPIATATPGGVVCGRCKEPMRYNVPRLGAAGGHVHANSGRYECQDLLKETPPPEYSPNLQIPEPPEDPPAVDSCDVYEQNDQIRVHMTRECARQVVETLQDYIDGGSNPTDGAERLLEGLKRLASIGADVWLEHPEWVNYRAYGDSIMLRVMCPVCGRSGANGSTYQPKCLPCDALMLPASNDRPECKWETFIDFLVKRKESRESSLPQK